MNRQIKFRAWDKEQKSMWIGGYIVFGMPLMTDVTDLHQTKVGKYPRKDSVLMQFTGLLDKNGKEIYEGDIIQGLVKSDIGILMDCRGEVRWNQKFAAFEISDDTAPLEWQDVNHNAIEIIGNIYENPELLK